MTLGALSFCDDMGLIFRVHDGSLLILSFHGEILERERERGGGGRKVREWRVLYRETNREWFRRVVFDSVIKAVPVNSNRE